MLRECYEETALVEFQLNAAGVERVPHDYTYVQLYTCMHRPTDYVGYKAHSLH